jgi:uncharacterized protein YjbI with pentapeptide repeats
MALWTGQSYVTNYGRTTVIQGALTPEQREWSKKDHDKDIDAITYLPLTPAQKLYLALCKNRFNLPKALASCDLNKGEAAEAQQALEIHDADGVVRKITRPSFVGANLDRYDLEGAALQGADLSNADLRGAILRLAQLGGADLREANLKKAWLWHADLRGADLRGANLQGADLKRADLQEADLRGVNLGGAQMQGADLKRADLQGADISGANFEDAKNLRDAFSLDLAFYCQDNPPKNLVEALNGVAVKQRPMALTKQEYDKVCRLRDSNRLLAFGQELERLRDVCNTRIDSQQQVDDAVDTAKAKFAWFQPLVSTTVAIMFSPGFDKTTRAAWYGNGAGGNVLQGISNRLEVLNHLVGRGSR